MGVGTPSDLAHAVMHGIDLFDCSLPTRNARHGVLYTRTGTLRIKNAAHRRDPRPVDEACGCSVWAFLPHLVRSGELTGAVLATRHNLRFYLDFVTDLREAIASGAVAERAVQTAALYPDKPVEPEGVTPNGEAATGSAPTPDSSDPANQL